MNNTLKIVSFNIRCLWDSKEDGVNSFIHRAGMILLKIDEVKPDVICFQEVSPKIRKFLEKYLVDYNLHSHGRDKNFDGEGLAIAYRKNSVDTLTVNCFWLSDTPNVPGSRFENQSEYPRICISSMIKKKDSEKPFYVYNIHLDHINESARLNGIKCVLNNMQKDRERLSLPFFLLGDFNAEPTSSTIEYCSNSELVLTDFTKDIEYTFHSFAQNTSFVKIDYIFSDKITASRSYKVSVWDDIRNGIFLSDHYPVCLEIEL